MKRLVLVAFTLLLVIVNTSNDKFGSLAENDPRDTEQPKPELVLQTGHSKLVKAVVFSPDNRWVASASYDSTIKIWDSETGTELRSLAGHAGAVKALVCSPNGALLASGGNDGAIRIWDVETGSEIKKIDDQKGTIEAIAFSRDGRRLASGGSDNTVSLWDVETGKLLSGFPGHNASITALTFSPDASLLASGSSDKSIKIWDTAKGKKLRDLKGHSDEISVLRFSENGSIFASGSLDKTVRLWRSATGDKIGGPYTHSDKVLALHFISAEELMSADAAGKIRTWDTLTKAAAPVGVGPVERNFTGEAESAMFSQDGAFLVIGNGAGTATISDTKTGQTLHALENHTVGFYGVAFSSDRRWLASASSDNTVKLWDLQTGQSLSPLKGHAGRVRSIAFLPDNRRVVTGSIDHSIRIWDTVSFKALTVLEGHSKSVGTLAISREGKMIVSGSADNTVGVWDIETKTSRFLKQHTGEVISVAISDDDKFIASASMDATVRIWDARTGQTIRQIEPKMGEIDAVAFSPDGRFLASGGVDKVVSIWEVETGKLVRTLPGHTGQIYSLAFSTDGQEIISTGQDKTVRSWNVRNGSQIRTMIGHVGSVFSVTFLPDDRWFASASEDGSIIIWNKETGTRLATLLSLRDSDDWLVVTPEGFFDGSQPSWRQISWRFEKNTFNVKPVEEFFSEFWLPGLLSEVLSNRKLPSNTNISKKDRRQPVLKISLSEERPGALISKRDVKVRIDVSQAPAGAKDVRLFRNGVLTRMWRNDVLKGQSSAVLEATIPVVAGENRLIAYAFNTDGIKSKDRALSVMGSPELSRKGVMYILAIGVNEYANPEYDLKVAVNDANEFSDEFKRQQSRLDNFERTETTTLLNRSATKANILKALSGLADQIKPEDAFVVFFAGHGTAQDKRFYLIPHDLGYLGTRSEWNAAGLKTILANSLSDEELEGAVENIDAGQFLLVIDACNSGQALETEETRRGPMNSKGLAQLAYEKGIYILTAAQGFQAAKEDERLGHGYLTFALIEEGLKANTADRQPNDGQILLREWLDYAAERVPQIDQEEQAKEGKKSRKLEREKSKSKDAEGPQRPRVFFRRESEVRPLVVGRR